LFDLHAPSAPCSLKTPLVDGLVEDWEVVEAILQYSLKERLGCTEASMAGHPFLLAEHLYASKADREKWCELLFERFGCAGTFMSRAGVLALYSNARTTGLAIDMGAGGTQITPVQEGYALMAGARLHPVGGALLDACAERALTKAGVRIDPRMPVGLPPRPGFKEQQSEDATSDYPMAGPAGVAAPRQPASAAHPAHHPSVRAWAVGCAVSDLKRALFRVVESPLDGGGVGDTVTPPVPYELPDGTTITVGHERVSIPELIFDPAPLHALTAPLQIGVLGAAPFVVAAAPSPSALGSGQQQQFRPYAGAVGLPETLVSAVTACDGDVRRELVAGAVLTGGASGLPGLHQRLSSEFASSAGLKAFLPASMTPKIALASKEERAIGAWLGGSILGSLSSFPELWFSKAEYAEHGAKMLHRKCP
jgi:actin-related protein